MSITEGRRWPERAPGRLRHRAKCSCSSVFTEIWFQNHPPWTTTTSGCSGLAKWPCRRFPLLKQRQTRVHMNIPAQIQSRHKQETVSEDTIRTTIWIMSESVSRGFNSQNGTLTVQWLRLPIPNAGDPGSFPGQGTKSHMLQLRPSTSPHRPPPKKNIYMHTQRYLKKIHTLWFFKRVKC